MWIAGGGEQRTLRIVAEEAAYANFLTSPDMFARKRTVLANHCERVGRDPTGIGLSTNFVILCGSSEALLERDYARLEARFRRFADAATASERAARPRAMSGTPDQIFERLGTWVEEGLDYAIVYFPDAAYGDSVERFASEVMPHFT